MRTLGQIEADAAIRRAQQVERERALRLEDEKIELFSRLVTAMEMIAMKMSDR